MNTKERNFLRNAFLLPRMRTHHWMYDTFAVITLVAITFIILESVDAYAARFPWFFRKAEIIFMGVFAIEYAVSLFTASKRTWYVFSFVGIADFFAFFPTLAAIFYPPFLALRPLRVLKIIRVMRLLRVHKGKHPIFTKGRDNFFNKNIDTQSWYTIRTYFFALFSSVAIFGMLIYLVEHENAGTPFTNIPQGMWWAIVTLATVGYGDIVPHTVLGRIIAAVTMVSGLVLFALLVSIVRKIAQKMILGKE